MKMPVKHERGLKGHIKRYVLLVLPALMFAGCFSDFDAIMTREVAVSKIVESSYTFTSFGNAATPRRGAASAVHNGWLYLYGGEDSSGVLNDFWKINIETGTAVSIDSDISRAYHSMAVLGDKLYVFGGIDDTGEVIAKNNGLLKSYDTTSGLWDDEIKTSDCNGTFPEGRSGHAAFAHDGFLFIQGGEDNGSRVDNDLHRFEFKANTSNDKHVWTQPVSAEYRAGHGAVVINDVVYLSCGYDPSDNSYYKNMWTYDIINGNTAEITVENDLLERKNIALASLDSILFTFSGETPSGIDNLLLAGTEMGDWFSYDSGITGRSGYILESTGTELLLHGGHSDDTGLYYDDLWIISKGE